MNDTEKKAIWKILGEIQLAIDTLADTCDRLTNEVATLTKHKHCQIDENRAVFASLEEIRLALQGGEKSSEA
jgi:hypothetical protein